jgi:hypothetical protein
MQVKRVKLDSLKAASYNPESRTLEGSRNLAALKASIEKIGLVYPIAVDSDGNVIDGHRRLACAKMLGWEDIPVLIIGKGVTADEAYAEINACNQKMDGNQTLQVYLKNPNAVTVRSRRTMESYEQMAGRDLLVRAAKQGTSVRVFMIAKSICQYVSDENPAFYKKTVKWLMKHRNQVVVSHYIRLQLPAQTLHRAITANKEFAHSFAVGE